MNPWPRREIRLTDADREHVVGLLFTAHRDGRITLGELDRRLAAVYAAAVAGELEPVLADVPTAAERRALAGEVLELDAGAGGLTRAGRWSVPRRVRVQQDVAGRGLVLLDLSAADVAHREVEVELRLGMWGSARLLLPAGSTADLSRLRGRGRPPRSDVPALRGTTGVHVTVLGRAPYRRSVAVRSGGSGRRWWW